jgi:hypothetical protein
MKSHDYHVFMQKLIPIAYRDLVPKEILDTFIEISNFFRDIYSSKFHTQHIGSIWKNLLYLLL